MAKEPKLKGAYNYKELDWNKDASALVCQKAVEKYFLTGTPILDSITKHTEKEDFLCCIKVGSGGTLYWGDQPEQSITRYYVSVVGKELKKVLVSGLQGDCL
jgi:hypothetical protein